MAENTTIEKKYLDLTGLSEFWKRVKSYVDTSVNGGGTALDNLINDTKINGVTILGQDTSLNGTTLYMSAEDNAATISSVIEGITNDLSSMKVNGKSLYDATKTSPGQSITLYAGDIRMSSDDSTSIYTKIDALSSATHFRGLFDATPTISNSNYVDGDIIIVIPKDKSSSVEYICYDGEWIELGDTTAELAAIANIENWIQEKAITSDDLNDPTNFPGLPSLES